MMKKVLLVAQCGLNRGGIQTVIMSYVRALSNKYTFDIILFTREKRDYDDEFSSYGGKIFRISYGSKSNRLGKLREKFLKSTKGYFEIQSIIRDNGPYDIIHCHNGIECLPALRAAKKFHIPKRLTHAHIIFDDSSNNFIFRLKNKYLKKQINKYATCQIGCSDYACKSLFFGYYKVVLNPYDENCFKQEKYDIPVFQAPSLIQVGNISDLKNQFFSVCVLEQLIKKYPNSKLTIVGKGLDDYEISLKKIIREKGLNEHVRFCEPNSDIPKLMSSSSYLIQPSRTESFCIVLVEAQVMGLRCFAADVIPPEANAGGVSYLSIKVAPDIWSDEIAKDFELTRGKHNSYDCSIYKSSEITKIIDKIYDD